MSKELLGIRVTKETRELFMALTKLFSKEVGTKQNFSQTFELLVREAIKRRNNEV